MFKQLLWLLLPISLAACTSKELYNHTQMQVKHQCNQKVGVEREQCLEQSNEKSYDDYEKERQDIMSKK